MIGMKSSGVSGRLQAILFAVLDKNRFLAGFMVIDGYDFHKGSRRQRLPTPGF